MDQQQDAENMLSGGGGVHFNCIVRCASVHIKTKYRY